MPPHPRAGPASFGVPLAELAGFTGTRAERLAMIERLEGGDWLSDAKSWSDGEKDALLLRLTRLMRRGGPERQMSLFGRWRHALLQAGASPWRPSLLGDTAFRCWLQGRGRFDVARAGWAIPVDVGVDDATWREWGMALLEEPGSFPATLSAMDWHDLIRMKHAGAFARTLAQRGVWPWVHPAETILSLADEAPHAHELSAWLDALAEAAPWGPAPGPWQGEAVLTWLGAVLSPLGARASMAPNPLAHELSQEWPRQWAAWARMGHWVERGVPPEVRVAVRRAFAAHAHRLPADGLRLVSAAWREQGLVSDLMVPETGEPPETAWRGWSAWVVEPAMADETEAVLDRFPLLRSGVWWALLWGDDRELPDSPGPEKQRQASPPPPSWAPSGDGASMGGPVPAPSRLWAWGRQAMPDTDTTAILTLALRRGRGRFARFFLACGAKPREEDADPQRTQDLWDALDASASFADGERVWVLRTLMAAGWRGHERLLRCVLKRPSERTDDREVVQILIEHGVQVAMTVLDADIRRPSVALWQAARLAQWAEGELPVVEPGESKGRTRL